MGWWEGSGPGHIFWEAPYSTMSEGLESRPAYVERKEPSEPAGLEDIPTGCSQGRGLEVTADISRAVLIRRVRRS